uniref:Endonuclease/exonuclease/phosphatase domain-containing protein n=1 Tax=Brassica oleracea var. oleracea TaxID=109376 RepID=A0A0D3ACK8_BRAOL
MASRWWDPGDLGVCGEFSSREGDKGIRERLRNHRILGDLLAILILIKTVSQSRKGNMSGDCQSTYFGFLMEIGGINYRLVSIKGSGIFVWVFEFCQSLPGIVKLLYYDAEPSVGECGGFKQRGGSYKGVVINGNGGQKTKERDSRDYYGKGKGKMFEEQESKWVKVLERGNKKNSNYRGNYRGDGGVSRSRGARREESRAWEQEGHSRFSSGQEKEHHGRGVSREKDREKGEIMDTRVAAAALPSQQFQLELAETQARGTVVISDPIDTEKGLQALQGLGEGKPDHVDDDYIMGMDEVKAAFLEYDIDMDAADDLEDVTEVEMEDFFLDKESVAPLVETVQWQSSRELARGLLSHHAVQQEVPKCGLQMRWSNELQQRRVLVRGMVASNMRVREHQSRSLAILRGMGSHWTISYLREIWHKHKPDFLFLSETKQDFEFVQKFQSHVGYDHLVTVDPNGRSGGLALFYNNDYQVQILYSSNRMIRMIDVEAVALGKKVYLTFVYGEPVQKLREQVWERLTRYGLSRTDPWFILGDLNEITGNHEKDGETAVCWSFQPGETHFHGRGEGEKERGQ